MPKPKKLRPKPGKKQSKNYPPEPPPARVRVVRAWVRCLGPSTGEHFFFSAHPAERVCTHCREKQRKLCVSPRMLEPLAVSGPRGM